MHFFRNIVAQQTINLPCVQTDEVTAVLKGLGRKDSRGQD
jgi:hypothetical protein